MVKIGEAAKSALHTLDLAVHETRKEDQELTTVSWISVRYREVQEVRDQREARVVRRLVALEAKVRDDVCVSLLGFLHDVRSQASHNG